MKIFLLLVCALSVAKAEYYNTPSYAFFKGTYGLSESEKEKILVECKTYLDIEKDKLLKSGLTILSTSPCKRFDLPPGQSGEADYVKGSIQFIR